MVDRRYDSFFKIIFIFKSAVYRDRKSFLGHPAFSEFMYSDKILCVLPKDPVYKGITDIAQLPEHIGKEIQHFFSVYKALEGKKTEVGAIEGPEAAKATVKACIEAYKKKQ